jgi:hypothetical protein
VYTVEVAYSRNAGSVNRLQVVEVAD